jgi:hypothetical protein
MSDHHPRHPRLCVRPNHTDLPDAPGLRLRPLHQVTTASGRVDLLFYVHADDVRAFHDLLPSLGCFWWSEFCTRGYPTHHQAFDWYSVPKNISGDLSL